MTRSGTVTALVLTALLLAPAGLAAEGPRWVTGVGGWGGWRDGSQIDTVGSLLLEARFEPVLWGAYPLAGVLLNGDGGGHFRIGIGRDLRLGPRWVISLTSGGGYYEAGDGIDLGHDFEFRSAFDLAYELANQVRIGLSVSHLSNAGISEVNPGTETVELLVSWRR